MVVFTYEISDSELRALGADSSAHWMSGSISGFASIALISASVENLAYPNLWSGLLATSLCASLYFFIRWRFAKSLKAEALQKVKRRGWAREIGRLADFDFGAEDDDLIGEPKSLKGYDVGPMASGHCSRCGR